MRTAVWQRVPNRLIPQIWGKQLETIKWKSNNYRLREYLSYSLSFQKEQLDLYLSEYYLDTIYKDVYRLIKDMNFVQDDRTFNDKEIKRYAIIYSVEDFINFMEDYPAMKYCAGYSLNDVKDIFSVNKSEGSTFITVGDYVKDEGCQPIIYCGRTYLPEVLLF